MNRYEQFPIEFLRLLFAVFVDWFAVVMIAVSAFLGWCVCSAVYDVAVWGAVRQQTAGLASRMAKGGIGSKATYPLVRNIFATLGEIGIGWVPIKQLLSVAGVCIR